MEDIVKAYFSRGQLLTPEAADILASVGYKDVPGKLVITKEDIFDADQKEAFKIVKNLDSKPKEFTTHDFVNFYNSKYEKISKIIQERTKKTFVSLNKLTALADVYVIGMVKDVKEKDGKFVLDIEDPTASRPVIFNENPGVELDDVLGIRAVSRGNVLFGKQVLYPDVPLRQPATGHGKACFISDLHLDEAPESMFADFIKWFRTQDINTLFVVGDIGDERTFEKIAGEEDKRIVVIPGDGDYPALPVKFGAENIISLSNPASVQLNGLNILLIHDFSHAMLTKRYLGRSKDVLKEDYLILEDVPDIVHCGHTHKPFVENYKSITIVNSGSLLTEFRPVIVDFATREIRQVEI
ncbi:MAG: metallophosphoesterase family protein [Candidatus Aenigmarchaeota archaeon]|nr:metallophosphoesterase family protein [Candidatus Aenigmarchaeota archaeon]